MECTILSVFPIIGFEYHVFICRGKRDVAAARDTATPPSLAGATNAVSYVFISDRF